MLDTTSGPTDLNSTLREPVYRQAVRDMHAHLYPSTLGNPVPNATGRTDPAGQMLWGVDE